MSNCGVDGFSASPGAYFWKYTTSPASVSCSCMPFSSTWFLSCMAHPAGLRRQKLPLETPQAILGQNVFSRYLSVNSFLPHPRVSTPNNFQEEELQQVVLVPLHSDFSAIQRWSHPLQQGILFSPGRVEVRSSSMGVISWLKGGDWHIPAILTLYVLPTYHR